MKNCNSELINATTLTCFKFLQNKIMIAVNNGNMTSNDKFIC